MIKTLAEKIKGQNVRLVFPEADDPRVLVAALRGANEKLWVPVLLGDPKVIKAVAEKDKLALGDATIIDPLNNPYYEQCLTAMVSARNGKNTLEQCAEFLKGRNYLAIMLVYLDLADGALGGATYSTADTIRPALQIIKTRPGIKSVSSSFIMLPKDSSKAPLVMGDCAVLVSPTAQQLADIAVATAATARTFNIDPRVALLSFSTKGSAKTPETEKVAEAYQILLAQGVDFLVDGELQFDAAFIPRVGAQKAPNSQVAGTANTFIFPSLEAGNIGYKMAQYLGDYLALGPILQGLNAPVNDLSRGCNAEEVFQMAIITCAQAMK